jgi:MFS family permease
MATISASASASPSDRRASVLILLVGLVVLLNYVDRGAIAIAAPLLKGELHLTATKFGLAVSAFFWVYAPIQYIVGWLCDRYCVYRALAAGLAIWALSTFFTGFVGGLASLVVLRVLLGLGESVTFPAGSKLIARHVPSEQRGYANSLMAAGIALGPALGTLAGGTITAFFGWRPMFWIFGLLTLLWLMPWLATAKALPAFAFRQTEQRVAAGKLLKQPAMWAMGIGHFATTYGHYFILTWLPLFLVQSHGFTIARMTLFATIAYLAQGASAFLFGWLSDYWVRSGWSETKVRRGMMIGSLAVMALTILLLAAAMSPAAILSLLILYGVAAAPCSINLYAIAQMFAGPRASGSWIGVQNATGNMSGIVSPIITGIIIDSTHSYWNAFILTAAVCAAGALWWAFGVPKIEQVALD